MKDQPFNELPEETAGVSAEPNGQPKETQEQQVPTEQQETAAPSVAELGSCEPLPEQEAAAEPTAEQPAESVAQGFAYHWDYDTQCSHDREKLKTQKKSGAVVYAIVMAVAFFLCLCVLGGVVIANYVQRDKAVMTTAEVAELVNPATVLIYASSSSSGGYGTGFFVRSDGYIVTNCHVVDGMTSITVTMYNGGEYEAAIKWTSVADDLAVIKIDAKDCPVVSIGNSDDLRIGDTAIAIGNPAGNVCPWTTTQGIISSTAREISVEGTTAIIDMTLLQTDAQVNPGNSGGPLCNDRGEVIGIVVRKLTNYESLGFAIPINGAMELVNAYLTTGTTDYVVSSISRVRPTIGIQAAAVKKGEPISDTYSAPVDGILVVGITEGGPAVGLLQVGDIITEMGGQATLDMDDVRELLYQFRAGDTVRLKINRMGEVKTVDITLGTATK